jgi:hypothetical protein
MLQLALNEIGGKKSQREERGPNISLLHVFFSVRLSSGTMSLLYDRVHVIRTATISSVGCSFFGFYYVLATENVFNWVIIRVRFAAMQYRCLESARKYHFYGTDGTTNETDGRPGRLTL